MATPVLGMNLFEKKPTQTRPRSPQVVDSQALAYLTGLGGQPLSLE
jgi:hypothetical protein